MWFKMPFYKSYWYAINPHTKTILTKAYKTHHSAIIPSEILENTYSAITGDKVQGFIDKGFVVEDVV